MTDGVVKTVRVEAGYGFIAPSERGPDLFFHASALVGIAFDATLQDRPVRFKRVETERGPRASEVHPL